MTRQENGDPTVSGPRRSGEPTSPFGASAVLPEIPSVRGRARAEPPPRPSAQRGRAPRRRPPWSVASPDWRGVNPARLAACFTAFYGSGRRADRASPGRRSTLRMALRPTQAGAQLDPESCEWAIHPGGMPVERAQVRAADEGARVPAEGVADGAAHSGSGVGGMLAGSRPHPRHRGAGAAGSDGHGRGRLGRVLARLGDQPGETGRLPQQPRRCP